MAKQYLQSIKPSSYVFLKDVGFFHNKFKEETLNADVLPWLFQQTETFVQQLQTLNKYPDSLISSYMQDVSTLHTQKVQEQHKRLDAIKEEQRLAEEAKIAEKARRKAAREAKKKAEEIARLREQIEVDFVQQGTLLDGILTQDVTDVDGYQKKDEGKSIGVIGGFLGQLMIVFNTVATYYPNLDRPSKNSHRTRQSNDSRPKTPMSEKSASKSQRSGASGAEDG